MTVENFVRIVWRVFEKIEKSRKMYGQFEKFEIQWKIGRKKRHDCINSRGVPDKSGPVSGRIS